MGRCNNLFQYYPRSVHLPRFPAKAVLMMVQGGRASLLQLLLCTDGVWGLGRRGHCTSSSGHLPCLVPVSCLASRLPASSPCLQACTAPLEDLRTADELTPYRTNFDNKIWERIHPPFQHLSRSCSAMYPFIPCLIPFFFLILYP